MIKLKIIMLKVLSALISNLLIFNFNFKFFWIFLKVSLATLLTPPLLRERYSTDCFISIIIITSNNFFLYFSHSCITSTSSQLLFLFLLQVSDKNILRLMIKTNSLNFYELFLAFGLKLLLRMMMKKLSSCVVVFKQSITIQRKFWKWIKSLVKLR